MLDHASAFGDPDAPTVVLLHPAGATRDVWRPHGERLREAFHVVAVDLPAHGRHPDAPFSFESAVTDVETVLDDADGGVVVGHSLGGYVAIRVAQAHGALVDGLLLAGASVNWRSPTGLALSVLNYALAAGADVAARSDRTRTWLEARLSDVTDDQRPPEDVHTHGALHGLARGLRASAFQDTWTRLDAYDGPTTLVHGTDEPFAGHARTLADRVDAAVHRFDGDHQAPVHRPDAFADLVAEFATNVVDADVDA